MNTKEYLTPEQVKHGFSTEIQNDVIILMLKTKKITFFPLKNTARETVQNTANILWEAYTLGLQEATKQTRGNSLFDTVGKDII